MSLVSKLLDDLEERQADLAGERDPVLNGLSRVTDRDFHITRNDRLIAGGIIALAMALGAWTVYRFGLFQPGAAPVVASAPRTEQTPADEPRRQAKRSSAAMDQHRPDLPPTLVRPTPTGDNPPVDSRAAIVAAQSLKAPAVSARDTASGTMPPALVDWSVRQDRSSGATITFRLTENVKYRLYPAIRQDRITLEFAADPGRAKELSYDSDQGLVRSVSADRNANGTARIVIDFSQPVEIADTQGDWSGTAFDVNVSVRPTPASSAPSQPEVAASGSGAATASPADTPRPSDGAPPSSSTDPAATPSVEEGASFSRIEVSAEDTYKKGLKLYQTGRVQEGIEQLRRALEKDPLHGDARTTLASCFVEQRQTAAAIDLLSEGLELNPRQFKWAELKAHLLVDESDIRGAIDTLQNELPAAAANPDYLGFLAALLQRANRHEEAAKVYEQIVAVTPANGIWWMGLGISLERIGNPVGARNAYQQALGDMTLTPDLRGYINRRVMTLSKR